MTRKRAIFKVATIILVVATLVVALYIMINGLGLNDRLDFGAGAYYYTDIPDFEKLLDGDEYTAKLPYWVYVLFFLVWGFLMYQLWKWVDRKNDRDS